MNNNIEIINPKIIDKFLDYNRTFNPNYSFVKITLKKVKIDQLLSLLQQNSPSLSSLTFIKQNYLFDDIEENDAIDYHITLVYNDTRKVLNDNSPTSLILKTPIEIDLDQVDVTKTLKFRPSNTPHKFFISFNIKDNKELNDLYNTNDLHVSIAHTYTDKNLPELNQNLKEIELTDDIKDLVKTFNSDIHADLNNKKMNINIINY